MRDGWARMLAPVRADPRLPALLLALAVTLGFFVQRPAWNQNSRLALTRAIVERGSVRIDPDHPTTGDKSFREGHFYSDKAPGTSVLAVPAYAVVAGVRGAVGLPSPGVKVRSLDPLAEPPPPEELKAGDVLVYNRAHLAALYVCTLATSGLLTVVATLAVYLLVLGGGTDAESRNAALFAALGYAVATPALPYATAMYGHQPCAAFLVLAVLLTVRWPLEASARAGGLACGASLGLAVVCEYPAAIPVVLICAFAAWRRGMAFAAWVIVGGLPFAGLLAGYHALAFGHPLSTGYDHVYLPEFAEGMRVAYGLRAPDARVLFQLLAGSYRGLFVLSPLLLFAVFGLVAPLSNPSSDRGLAVLALGIALYYLLLNAGYYMWDGGSAWGPRHCLPMLPLLATGLGFGFRTAPRASLVALGISAIIAVLGALAGPEAPPHGNPVIDYALPELWSDRRPGHGAPRCLGHLLGLPGGLGLLPLGIAWVVAGVAARASMSRPTPTHPPDSSD